jgi:hypothetical protein
MENENEIEIVTNGDEVAVFGPARAVDRFVKYIATIGESEKFNSGKLASFVSQVAGGADAASKISETSGRWLQMTAESAKKVRELGLMPSAKHGNGIAHAILGEPGEIAGWLQVEVGSKTLFANPAVLSGVSNYLSQQSLQMDLKYIKETLQSLDEKLDDVLRGQLDENLSSLGGITLTIRDAKTRQSHNNGIVNSITWSQLDAQSFEISKLQEKALRKLDEIKSKALKLNKISSAPKDLEKIESEIALWLTVLGRTMELREELACLELASVENVLPTQLASHSRGITASLENRRTEIRAFVSSFLAEISQSSRVALKNVILHSKKANNSIDIVNNIAETGAKFASAFGDNVQPKVIDHVSVRVAMRDKDQLVTAGAEIATKAAVTAAAVGASLVTVFKFLKK